MCGCATLSAVRCALICLWHIAVSLQWQRAANFFGYRRLTKKSATRSVLTSFAAACFAWQFSNICNLVFLPAAPSPHCWPCPLRFRFICALLWCCAPVAIAWIMHNMSTHSGHSLPPYQLTSSPATYIYVWTISSSVRSRLPDNSPRCPLCNSRSLWSVSLFARICVALQLISFVTHTYMHIYIYIYISYTICKYIFVVLYFCSDLKL